MDNHDCALTLTLGENLHEILKLIFFVNYETYHQFVIRWISPESNKG